MSESIKKIIIVGRDADAWISALVLQLQLAKSNVQVMLVELPSQLYTQDFYSLLPTHRNLHEIVGLQDEFGLLKASAGLPILAQRFANWSGAEEPFYHAYDSAGINIGHVEFLQCWLKARNNGLQVPLDDFSVGAVAAKQGKFLVFEENPGPLSRAKYGYNLGAFQYLRTLGRLAINAGVKHSAATIKNVAVDNGRIISLELSTGEKISADLYIDASGVEARLIGTLKPDDYEPWDDWFPCDRVMVASAAPLSPVPAFNNIAAFAEGWIGSYPLLNRTGLRVHYSSAHANREQLLQNLVAFSGNRREEIKEYSVRAGIRKHPWVGNCIAVGETAANIESIESTELHLLHMGLMLLRVLFPVGSQSMPEATEFNQRFYAKAMDVRDFAFAHYALNRRFGEPMWDRLRDKKLSENLREKIELFSRRGEVCMREDQTFQESSWISLLIGHGIKPAAYNPLVDNIAEAELIKTFKNLLHHIATIVAEMPSLQTHIEMSSTPPINEFGL